MIKLRGKVFHCSANVAKRCIRMTL